MLIIEIETVLGYLIGTYKLRFLYFHIIFVSLNYLVINKIKIQIIKVPLVFVSHFCFTSKFEGG